MKVELKRRGDINKGFIYYYLVSEIPDVSNVSEELNITIKRESFCRRGIVNTFNCIPKTIELSDVPFKGSKRLIFKNVHGDIFIDINNITILYDQLKTLSDMIRFKFKLSKQKYITLYYKIIE